MNDAAAGNGSAAKRWGLAVAMGVLVLIMTGAIAGYGWGAALFLAVLTVILLGLLFEWLYGTEPPRLADHAPAPMVGAGTVAAARASEAVTSHSGGTAAREAEAATQGAATGSSAPAAPAAAAKPDPAKAEAVAEDTVSAAAEEVEAAKTEAASETAEAPKTAAASAPASEASAAASTSEVEAKPAPAADATLSDAEPVPGAKGASEVVADEAGARPEGLSGPRDGGADNLKEIKGVGPKLEELLHGLGIYHFDQIAAWGAAEVAWMDSNLKGFRGRVTRDDWVDQAKVLAAGGDTEFSSRVDAGKVY